MTFTWQGATLDYFDHPYNTTARNERAIEIPIAFEFLARHRRGVGLELGNVLGHYGVLGHDVVDLYEAAPGVRNVDVFDVTGAREWIVSVSTVEHICWDYGPTDPAAAVKAVEHLRGLLAERGHMLITVPLGHHPRLDEAVGTGVLEPADDCVYVRDGDSWARRPRGTWRPYGETTDWAEAVWVGTWGPT